MCIACATGGREPKVFDCLEMEVADAAPSAVDDDPAFGAVPDDMRFAEGGRDVSDGLSGAQAIGVGELVTGTISVAGDQDVYAVRLEAGRRYVIDLDPRGSSNPLTDTYLYVYDANGNLVAANDDADSGDLSSRVEIFPTEDTIYYVQADAFGSNTGAYQMRVADRGIAPPASPTDALEWNYTAPSTISVYVVAGGQTFTDAFGSTYTTTGWNATELDALVRALGEYERVINVDFEIVSDPSQADFMVIEANLGDPNDLGYWGVGGGRVTINGTNYALDGFGVFNGGGTGWNAGGLQAGGLGYQTIVHEFGHGMGLAHPHDVGGGSEVMRGVSGAFDSLGQYDLNQGVFTTMSYNRGWNTGPSGASGNPNFGGLDGLGTFDIAVLQDRYGAAASATGDDVYILPSANGAGTAYRTIWDTAGSDAITAFDMRGDAVIDLRTADTSDYAPNAGGFVSYVSGVFGGFVIAEGVVIETGVGGRGNDRVIGNGADNALSGNQGNDLLYGGFGNDTLNGGGGVDTALYDSVRRQSDIEGNAVARRTVSGVDGNDTLLGIERISFADGGLSFDAGSSAAQVFRLFNAAFDRSPDAVGQSFHTNSLENGATITNVAVGFISSPEFLQRYGSTTNNEFVTLLYNNVLDRNPDSSGLQYWTSLLQSGARSRAEVLVGFSESPEHIEDLRPETAAGLWYTDAEAASAARLYYAALDRAPDAAGLIYYRNILENGADLSDIANGFAASPEFRDTYGPLNNGQFVDLLYNNVLGREADAAGRDYYIQLLRSGQVDRGDVLLGFSESPEHQAVTANVVLDDGIVIA